MNDAPKLYLRRKLGEKMGKRYFISSLSPLLILIVITAALSFSLSFIMSMSEGIDRLLAVMGSGSVRALSKPDISLLPSGSELSETKDGSALLYAENGESAVMLKGIDWDYLNGMRKEYLEIAYGEKGINPIVISSSLADELSLSLGDRLTMLMWEGERARPMLSSVYGIFASVYPQLDHYLVYVSSSSIEGYVSYEILLPEGIAPEETVEELWKAGIPAESYRSIYSSLYMNVNQSIAILSFIIILVALLASFFSSDAAHYYIARDRNDISTMRMLGVGRRAMIGIYMCLTLSYVFISALAGMLIGTLLSFLTPDLMSLLAKTIPSLLDYYITSFRMVIPYSHLALMLIAMLLVSALSVFLSLCQKRLLP